MLLFNQDKGHSPYVFDREIFSVKHAFFGRNLGLA